MTPLTKSIAESAASSPSRQLRIYVAERDDALRERMSVELEAAGHAVAAASDGDEMLNYLFGIALVPMARPDVMVLGENLPSFDSLQLLHLMRDADWDIPVVLVVENADEVRTSPAVAAGRTEVVAKTELTEGLLAAIAAAMTREESAPPTVPERRSGVRLTSTCDREELGDDAPRQSA